MQSGASVGLRDPKVREEAREAGAPAGHRQAIDLDTFCRIPARYIHLERFLACVAGIPPGLAARVLGCSRLHPNLSERIVALYGLDRCTPTDFTETGRRIALLDGDQLRRVGELAGGVWHAQALRSIILVHTLRELLAEFDPRLHRVALTNMDLSPKPDRPLDPSALVAAIRSDGMHCLNAATWQLPAALRSRILLRFPTDSPLGSPVSVRHQQLGPLIVDRVLADEMVQ